MESKPAVLVLCEFLLDTESDVRAATLRILRAKGQLLDVKTIQIIRSILENGNEDLEVRMEAARTISVTRERGCLILTSIALDKIQPSILRLECINNLGAMGRSGRFAVTALGEILSDQDKDLRRASIEALGKLGRFARNSVDALRTVEDFKLRDEVQNALRSIKNDDR